MDIPTISIGFLVLVYGIYALISSVRGERGMFRKLEHMKKKWGNRTGTTIHFAVCILVPILLGIIIIWAGLNGAGLIWVYTK
jgi:hypothetical protein